LVFLKEKNNFMEMVWPIDIILILIVIGSLVWAGDLIFMSLKGKK